MPFQNNSARTLDMPADLKSAVPHAERALFEVDLSNPMHIHQHALDQTGEALQTGDFELFADFFHLPHLTETFPKQQLIKTKGDLQLLFRNSRVVHEEAGATHRIRDSISAKFLDATTLNCAHVSRIMNGNYQLRDAVPCHSTFELIDGVWLLTRSVYALEESKRPFDSLLTRHGAPLEFKSS